MNSGGGFDFIVAAVNRELAARPQVISTQRHRRRNYNVPGHAVQRQVAAELRFVLPAGAQLSGDISAVEDDLRVLGRLKNYLAQFLVDDLFLLRREHAACLFERVGAHTQVQRGRAECAGRKLRFAGEIADTDEVVVPLEEEQTASEGPHHELTPTR